MDIYASTAIASALAIGRDGQRVTGKRDGIVSVDRTLMFHAECVLNDETRWPGTIGRTRLPRGDRESGIEAGQIVAQHLVGFRQGRGPGLAQLFDQSILEGAKEPFDPPFGQHCELHLNGTVREKPSR